MEVWKKINQSDLYEISSIGRMRSLRNNKILNNYINNQGYCVCAIRINGKSKGLRVHRLVAEAFIEKPQGKDVINHINSNRSDNRVENLEWCTNQENCRHGVDFRKNLGEAYQTSKLTEEMVIEILKIGLSVPRKELARKFNTDDSNITLILSGETWRHVGDKIGFDYSKIKTRKTLIRDNAKLESQNQKLRSLLERAKPWVEFNQTRANYSDKQFDEWLKEYDEIMGVGK